MASQRLNEAATIERTLASGRFLSTRVSRSPGAAGVSVPGRPSPRRRPRSGDRRRIRRRATPRKHPDRRSSTLTKIRVTARRSGDIASRARTGRAGQRLRRSRRLVGGRRRRAVLLTRSGRHAALAGAVLLPSSEQGDVDYRSRFGANAIGSSSFADAGFRLLPLTPVGLGQLSMSDDEVGYDDPARSSGTAAIRQRSKVTGSTSARLNASQSR